MRILVHEQHHTGHYYYYVHYLLPALLEITKDVVVAISKEGQASAEYADLLAPFADRVAFEAVLPSAGQRVAEKRRWQLCTDLRETVRRIRPDYVLVPSGDQYTTFMGAYHLSGVGALPRREPAEVGIHFGMGSGAESVRDRLQDFIWWSKLAAGGWSRVHVVNVLFYEYLKARGGRLGGRSSLLPHPVKPNTKDKRESRRRLGLPEDGRIIGIAGAIDRRKAVVELLAAFRNATSEPSDRLLLAGRIYNAGHRDALARDYQDLVRAGRVLTLDRVLDADTNQAALSAMDVVCLPYPGFQSLSSVLLEGLAAGRPVLANSVGWCEAVVRRFGVGWTCDVMNHSAFTTAIQVALRECSAYRQNEATARLLKFHEPQNFAASFLAGVKRFTGASDLSMSRSWTWVVEALPEPTSRGGLGV